MKCASNLQKIIQMLIGDFSHLPQLNSKSPSSYQQFAPFDIGEFLENLKSAALKVHVQQFSKGNCS
jgi:hypothetical protein